MKEKNQGITLIALIITIIILLILATISVNIAIKGDLFGKTEKAVEKANSKVGQTQGIVNELMSEWEKIKQNHYSDEGEKTEENVEENVEQKPCSHEWGEWQIIEEEGIKTRTCAICAEKETITLLIAGPHNWTKGTETNIDEIECSHCNTRYTIGDEVIYGPSQTSGVDVDGTIITQETNLSWIVLGIEDSDGDKINETLLITTKTPTVAKLSTDETTYNNICKSLYSNGVLSVEARGMNINDINCLIGYNPTGGFLGSDADGAVYYNVGFTTLKELGISEYCGEVFTEEQQETITMNTYGLCLSGTTLTEKCEEPVILTITTVEKNLIFGENEDYAYKIATTGSLLDSNNGLQTGLGGIYRSMIGSGPIVSFMFHMSREPFRPVVSFTQSAPVLKYQ